MLTRAFISFAAVVACTFAADDVEFINPTEAVSLADAVALTLRQNPDLRVYGWDIRAAEARAVQARLRPNPELSVELEDVRFQDGPTSRTRSAGITGTRSLENVTLPLPSGDVTLPRVRRGLTPDADVSRESGAEPGLSEAEITISLSQIIELGGKRARRIEVAHRERDVATWDYEIARVDVLSRTAIAFYEVLSAQERLKLAEALSELSRTMRETVGARVEAGKVSPIELSSAEVEEAGVRLQVERARRELDATRVRLAAQWGATTATFTEAAGALNELRALPELVTMQERIASSPDLARWQAELAQREAAIVLARAQGKPDLTVTLGLRSTGIGDRDATSAGISGINEFRYGRSSTDVSDDREETVVLGFSLPLPLFNRNQGAIEEAHHLASKAADQQRATEIRLAADLAAAYSLLSAIYSEASALETEIIPKATEAFEAIREGYRQGKFGLLDVLASQRTLFDTRSRLLDAQATYYQHVAAIERLTGLALFPLPEITTSHEEHP